MYKDFADENGILQLDNVMMTFKEQIMSIFGKMTKVTILK